MVSNEEAALAKEQSVRDGINVDVSCFSDTSIDAFIRTFTTP